MKKKEYNITNNGQIVRFSTRNTFPTTEAYLCINLENNYINLSKDEIDEFCELLQEKKKEIWKS